MPEKDDRAPKNAIRNKKGYYYRGEYDTYLVALPSRLIMTLEDDEGQEYTEDLMVYIKDYKLGHPNLKFRMTAKKREKLEKMVKERIAKDEIYVKVIPRKEGQYYVYGLYKLVEDFFKN
jgi:hypothetical protein